jgi:uncharacterized protein with FMN-binding domain
VALVLTIGGLALLLRHPSGPPTGASDMTDALGVPAGSPRAAASPAVGATDSRRNAGRPAGGPAAASTVTLGRVVNTEYGDVQVRITATNKRITAVREVRTTDSGRLSASINRRALPVLYRETLQSQSARIDAVSGATVTSDGYRQSLQSAIDLAHLG